MSDKRTVFAPPSQTRGQCRYCGATTRILYSHWGVMDYKVHVCRECVGRVFREREIFKAKHMYEPAMWIYDIA